MQYSKNQIGFKEKSRTADHIFTLKTIIDQYKQESFYCFHRLKKRHLIPFGDLQPI
jgi:hypothetical protein